MLVEMAIGDAYGAGFEFAPEDYVRKYNDASGYVSHPRHSLPPGTYTDDTQMAIALAEAILSQKAWTPETIAKYFVKACKRDPREGYAGGFYGFLQRIQNAEEFLNDIRPNSDKSGGAMRAAPVGIFSSPREVIEKCRIQAAITHDTPDGTNAAIASSLMIHYFLYDIGPKAELGAFLESHVAGDWSKPWIGFASVKGIDCVRAAVTAVMASNSLCELLQECIAFTGDTDTVAAIAMPAGASAEEIQNNLPDAFYNELENGQYGKKYLEELDKKILALKP
ncbi:MAG: ADP-ribosylglycohydrolase family protein [Candidatus Marinimicrobia bacterium]|nr:ADP-ribosylglycohydrolase family protein [Candidatus Neomarinimicrobiota bacterium]